MTHHYPNLEFDWLLKNFQPITLDELNTKAEMLTRIDNKYVVQHDAMQRALPYLVDYFDVLEIDQRRAFTYDTCYFDDPERSAYYEHHQGLRKGFKVRIRRYSDSELCYLEVKVKGKRGMTVKHRVPHDPEQIQHLSSSANEFARTTYSTHYQKPFEYDLHKVLEIRFKRMTLVAKSGGERMTIDTDIQFRSSGKSLRVGTNVFIVETKSELGRGYADKCLRQVKERPTSKCSKYCIGMATLGEVTRYNRFLPTMRKLNLVGKVSNPLDVITSLAA